MQVLHVLLQAALQSGQKIIGNKLTADRFFEEYHQLFNEKGGTAEFCVDPWVV